MATIAMTATFVNRVSGAVVSRWADFVSALEAVRLGGVCELSVYGGAPTEYDEDGDVVEYGFDVCRGGVDDELYIMDGQWACVAVVRLVRDKHGVVSEVVLVTAMSKYEYQYVRAGGGGVKCVYRGAVHGLLAQECLFDMSVSDVRVIESSRVGFVSGMTIEAFCYAYRLSFAHWRRARIGVGVDATWMDDNCVYRNSDGSEMIDIMNHLIADGITDAKKICDALNSKGGLVGLCIQDDIIESVSWNVNGLVYIYCLNGNKLMIGEGCYTVSNVRDMIVLGKRVIVEDTVAYVDEEMDVMDQLRGVIVGSRVKRSMVLPETLNEFNRYDVGIVEFIYEEICEVSEHRGKLGVRIEFPSAVRPGAGLGTTHWAYMSISDILMKGMFVQRVATGVDVPVMPDDAAIGAAMRDGAEIPVDGKREPKRRTVKGYVGQMPYYDVSEVHMETLTSGYGPKNTRFVRMKDGYSVQADALKRKDGTLIHISGQGWVYMSKVGYCLATLKGGMHGWTSPVANGDGEWLMMNPWSDGDAVLEVAQCISIKESGDVLYIRRRGGRDGEWVSCGKYIHEGRIVEVMAVPFKGMRTVLHLLFNGYGAVKGLEAHGVEHSTKKLHNYEVLTIGGVHYQLKGDGSLHHISDLNVWLIGVYEELVGKYDRDELLAYVGKMYSVCKEKRDNHVYRSNYNECYHERMKRSMMLGDEVVYEYSVTIYHGSGDKEVERACGVRDMSYSYDDDGGRLYEQTEANKLRLAYALGLLTIDDKEAVLDELTVIAEEQYADYLVKREASKAVLTDEDKAALRAAFSGDCTWLGMSVRFDYCVKDDVYMKYERGLYRGDDHYIRASIGSMSLQGIGIAKDGNSYIVICTADMQVLVWEYLGIGTIVKVEVSRALIGYEKDDEGNIVYSVNSGLREDLRAMVAEHIAVAGRVSSEYEWIDKAYGIGHRNVYLHVVSGSRMDDLAMLFQANHSIEAGGSDVLYRMWDSGAKWSELLGNSSDTNNDHGYAHGEYQSIEVKEWGVRLVWNSTWNSCVKMCGGWNEDKDSIKSVLWDGTVIVGEYERDDEFQTVGAAMREGAAIPIEYNILNKWDKMLYDKIGEVEYIRNKKVCTMLADLIQCGKATYADGEKAKYCGYMSRWTTVKEHIGVEHVFVWKQRLIERSFGGKTWLDYPCFSYRCVFMACTLRQDSVERGGLWHLNWCSGDDDLALHYLSYITEHDMNMVKAYILEHHTNDAFQDMFNAWCKETGLVKYRSR